MKRRSGGERHEAGHVFRDGIEAEIQVAEAGVGNAMRISGVANSFQVMRSGRVFHPRAFDSYLKSRPSGPFFGILAQHGNTPGFATIGRVTKLQASPRGLLFEAELASGTQLADEARTLVAQKMLTSVSLGWRSIRDRQVVLDEKVEREDPELARVMRESGATAAWVFYAVEPVELSLVDVADDGDARLAARSAARNVGGESIGVVDGAGGGSGVLTAAQFETLRADFDQNFRRLHKRLIADAHEVFETLLTEKALSYGEALLDDSIDDDELEELDELGGRGAGCKAHDSHGRKRAPAARGSDAADQLRRANAALDGLGGD